MKNILVTGKNSYIGRNFVSYMEKFPQSYSIKAISVRGDEWKNESFSGFDVLYHVAGIAHTKETKENEELFFSVNRDLSYEIAKKAKREGVKQFIFMSSVSTYGLVCSKELIKKDSPCRPESYYARSKFEAEELLRSLEDESFKVCIVRPPMVYGPDAPGNLGKLFRAVRRVHVFPTLLNERSTISISRLVESVRGYIERDERGIQLPQNDEYLCTYRAVKEQMESEGVKVLYTPIFNPLLRAMVGRVKLISKCFGDLRYES